MNMNYEIRASFVYFHSKSFMYFVFVLSSYLVYKNAFYFENTVPYKYDLWLWLYDMIMVDDVGMMAMSDEWWLVLPFEIQLVKSQNTYVDIHINCSYSTKPASQSKALNQII
jgi:hypothetical protein